MQTTLNLRDNLVAQAKALAVKECTTLTTMMEEGLALRLRRQRARLVGALKDLPVSGRSGGFRSGVDGTRNQSLLDATNA